MGWELAFIPLDRLAQKIQGVQDKLGISIHPS